MVQGIAWRRIATSHFLNQCWHRSMTQIYSCRPQVLSVFRWNNCDLKSILFLMIHQLVWYWPRILFNANDANNFMILIRFITDFQTQLEHSAIQELMPGQCVNLIKQWKSPCNSILRATNKRFPPKIICLWIHWLSYLNRVIFKRWRSHFTELICYSELFIDIWQQGISR